MRVQVRFRYNVATGEVEMFVVDAVDTDASDADHDRRHDAATAELAGLVDRHPMIDEIARTDRERERAPSSTVLPVEQEHEGRQREEPNRG